MKVHFSGLLYAQHPHWKIMRTFTLNSLRGDGMGRAVLEPQILEEIRILILIHAQTSAGLADPYFGGERFNCHLY